MFGSNVSNLSKVVQLVEELQITRDHLQQRVSVRTFREMFFFFFFFFFFFHGIFVIVFFFMFLFCFLFFVIFVINLVFIVSFCLG